MMRIHLNEPTKSSVSYPSENEVPVGRVDFIEYDNRYGMMAK